MIYQYSTFVQEKSSHLLLLRVRTQLNSLNLWITSASVGTARMTFLTTRDSGLLQHESFLNHSIQLSNILPALKTFLAWQIRKEFWNIIKETENLLTSDTSARDTTRPHILPDIMPINNSLIMMKGSTE